MIKMILVGIAPKESLVEGDIIFDHVGFSYPQRREQPVFTNLNLTIQAGKVTGEL